MNRAMNSAATRQVDAASFFTSTPREKKRGPARRVDTPAVLYDKAATVLGRIGRLAPFATPSMRLQLMGELALVENVLDSHEEKVVQEAQRTLAQLSKRLRKGAR